MSVGMDRARLWAKRWTGEGQVPQSAYLPGHLCGVYDSAQQVLDATGETQLRALDLPKTHWLDRLFRVVRLAAALHDLGKCNDQFQRMLKEQGRQALRHEWVTLLILDDPEWSQWLLPAAGPAETDWAIVRWCIAGHHSRYDRSAPPELAEGPMRMRLLLHHQDMHAIVDWLRKTFDLGRPPELAERVIDLSVGGDGDLDNLCHTYYEDEDKYDGFPRDLRGFVAVAKNCLVATDVAGSALPRMEVEDAERARWINAVLDTATLPGATGYRQIAASRLKCDPDELDDKLRPFQREVAAKAARVVFVKAGCGTGKTLAAYRWAEAECPGRRLCVCYPTTGTATEGFRDYLLDPDLAEHVKTNFSSSKFGELV